MRDGKGKEYWEHTANIMALLANINSGKNNKVYKADDINPYVEKRKSPLTVLRDTFVKEI